MKTGKLLAVAIFLGVICSAAAFAVEVPHTIIKLGSRRPVGFNHEPHLALGLKCGTCHHDAAGEPLKQEKVLGLAEAGALHCRSCHNADFKDEKLRSLRLVLHRSCKGCHKAGVNGVKGPTRCVVCHR